MASKSRGQASRQALVVHGTRWIIVTALAIGAVLGFGGNFVPQGNVQSIMFALSAVGLILASVLLAIEHGAAGHIIPATGFALIALGETRVLNPTDAAEGEGSFAVGVLLYAPGLVMIALSTWSPIWARLTAAVAAILFACYSLIYLAGIEVESTGVLAGIAYALFTITIVGWIITVVRSETGAPSRSSRVE